MLQSKLFTKTRKEAPKDEVSRNAELLIRAGYIHKEMAGVYDFLPLGLKVLNKINQIIREEMDAIGGEEVSLSILQLPDRFEKTGRWSDEKVDNWFKTKLKNDSELGLGLTHEEPLVEILKDHINSYRDLPCYIYQIGPKFRNELRAKSGIMRGREFSMKDMYSFTTSKEETDAFFESCTEAYKKVFARLGIGDRTYKTLASGGIFTTDYSVEFQTLAETGEDTIYIAPDKSIAYNKEILDKATTEFNLKVDEMTTVRSIEVGNIYKLGKIYTEPLGLRYKTETGEERPVDMGCYGLGPSRIMGTIAEIYNDDRGLIWPLSIAPFKVHLVEVTRGEDTQVKAEAEKLYSYLEEAGVEVLWDDRTIGAGEKFADADLIGIPYRVVVSERTIAAGKYELKVRSSGEVTSVSERELLVLPGILKEK